MNWQRIWALVAKDWSEVLANKLVVAPLLVVPLIFSVFLPVLITTLTFNLPSPSLGSTELIENLVRLYPVPPRFAPLPEAMVYVMLNFSFIPLLMIVPLMVSIVIAANAITGEKERHTLETLLATPLTRQELLVGKVLAAFLPAVGVGLVSFGLYFTSANLVSLLCRQTLVVDSWVWGIVVLFLGPAVSLLGLSMTLMVGLKAKSSLEAQQMSALVVLPLIALVAAQVSGLVVVSPLWLFGSGLVLLGLDAWLLFRVAPRFDREKVLDVL